MHKNVNFDATINKLQYIQNRDLRPKMYKINYTKYKGLKCSCSNF